MRIPSNREAEILREIRKELPQLAQRVESILRKATRLCEHEEIDANCPSCKVFHRARNLDTALGRLGLDLDDTLDRGPAPRTVP